jgi:hypothetical protein
MIPNMENGDAAAAVEKRIGSEREGDDEADPIDAGDRERARNMANQKAAKCA